MTDASPRILRGNQIVIAAGAWSGRIAEMARVGEFFWISCLEANHRTVPCLPSFRDFSNSGHMSDFILIWLSSSYRCLLVLPWGYTDYKMTKPEFWVLVISLMSQRIIILILLLLLSLLIVITVVVIKYAEGW